jgi:hypothetical protein
MPTLQESLREAKDVCGPPFETPHFVRLLRVR